MLHGSLTSPFATQPLTSPCLFLPGRLACPLPALLRAVPSAWSQDPCLCRQPLQPRDASLPSWPLRSLGPLPLSPRCTPSCPSLTGEQTARLESPLCPNL